MEQLAEKLTKIYEEVDTIPKSGYSDYGGYEYVTEPDLMERIRPLFAEHGIAVFPSVAEQSIRNLNDKVLTEVVMEFTIIDTDSGEEITLKSQGQGYDSTDKGGYKAITGAVKYFLSKLVLATTGDDPEGTAHEEETGGSSEKMASKKQAEFLADLLFKLDDETFTGILDDIEEQAGLEPETIPADEEGMIEVMQELVPSSVASTYIDELS